MRADFEDAANSVELRGGDGAVQIADFLRSLSLTERQRGVCDLVTQGFSNKEIGRRLGIGHRTVECHRAEIYRKVGVRNAIELVRKIFDRGISK